MAKYENLEQFFGCYFHQDWVDEADSLGKIIKNFIKENSQDYLLKVIQELTIFIEDKMPEEEKSKYLFEKLGCNCYVYYYGYKVDEWLIQLKELLLMGCLSTPS